MAAAIVFLRLNEIEPSPDSLQWEELVLDPAASRIDRPQITARLRKLISPLERKRETHQGFEGTRNERTMKAEPLVLVHE